MATIPIATKPIAAAPTAIAPIAIAPTVAACFLMPRFILISARKGMLASGESAPSMATFVMKPSRYSHSETVGRLSTAIIDAGNTIFATIDQAAAAKTVGLPLRPTTLIIFGNPKGGTPVMDAVPLVALELPLKLLVWEEGGNVSVAYVAMSEIAARYGVAGMDERIAAMDRAVDALVNIVV
jgi:uncharacterized protein (DUF302 family)